MAAKKDKMIPSEKERKRALKYATPAGTGRMWVTMGIAFVISGQRIPCRKSSSCNARNSEFQRWGSNNIQRY